MVEYVLAAMVGAILASVLFLVARLLTQQREQSAALQTSIGQQLDTIRQDSIQGRQPTETITADLQSLKQRLDDAIAARREADKTTADGIRECNKKLDAISGRLIETATAGGPVHGGSNIGETEFLDPFLKYGRSGKVEIGGGTAGGSYKGFVKPFGKFGSKFENFGKEEGSELDFGISNLEHAFPQSSPYVVATPGGDFESTGPISSGTKDAAASQTAGAAPSQTVTGANPGGPQPTAPAAADGDAAEDRRTVDLMFATTRKYDDAQERFTGERNSAITFGQAFVRIPEAHELGELERPQTYSLFSFTVYKQKEDPKKHFVLRGASILPKERWLEILGEMPSDDALLFVHGFNTSFEDALYRNAQIVGDLGFKGMAVLFSWPSRGAIADYVYDRDSALGARKPFIEVLQLLTSLANVKQIHILAHSMGNQVVLDALANYQTGTTPLRLGELVMAAPDVDRDLYTTTAVDARKLTKRMTLYASAADKALAASKFLAGAIPRAGDVPEGGPIVLENIDSIDATSLGEEIFGLNHGTFARSLSILNDVFLLLKGQPLPRVIEIKSVPDGVIPPKYWRYIAART